MTKEEFYQEKCIKESKRYQEEIEKLKAEKAEVNDLINVLTENKEIFLDMYSKATQQLMYEKCLLMRCCDGFDEAAEAINDHDEILKNFYWAFSELDGQYHKLTGEYLQ